MSLIAKFSEGEISNEIFLSEIKKLTVKHKKEFPRRFQNQNTYSENLINFKLT